ncbi:MAG: hypothetical protein M0R33_18805 [Methylomonas sp.]|jgi:hypothetical protein|uniref:hypothetical protein n=1 Tax=Methylomonas sp. TaxID=418 RepID=UPI0025FF8A39|nr:hypothetical protein [Methylomonas sp.]MCK9608495.1 hypothetical protein [Methylomonas sp.]
MNALLSACFANSIHSAIDAIPPNTVKFGGYFAIACECGFMEFAEYLFEKCTTQEIAFGFLIAITHHQAEIVTWLAQYFPHGSRVFYAALFAACGANDEKIAAIIAANIHEIPAPFAAQLLRYARNNSKLIAVIAALKINHPKI